MVEGVNISSDHSLEPHLTTNTESSLLRMLPPNTVRRGSSNSPATRRETPGPNLRGEITGNLLSNQETAVLKLAAKGLTNPDIARDLRISNQTVKNHSVKILTKMGVQTTVDAISEGAKLGIIPLDETADGFDLSRLGNLSNSERRTYRALARASGDIGYKELAYLNGISLSHFKTEASSIWKKLGITRRQIILFNIVAEDEKRKQNLTAENGTEVDIFEGLPVPDSVLESTEESSKLSDQEAQMLTLSAFGLTKPEIAELLELSYETTKRMLSNTMKKFDSNSVTDAVIKAMITGDIIAEAVIPEGFQLRLDSLSSLDREIVDALSEDPEASYNSLAPRFRMQGNSLKFKGFHIFRKLEVESREHAIIVVNALKLAEGITSEEKSRKMIA